MYNDFLNYYHACFASPWLATVLMLIGFVLLVKGADGLIDGASSLARRIGVSDLVVGLTVVAFGTSMPEFVVNMISAGQGNCALAITNVLGSNSINILVILGLTALLWPVSSQRQSRMVDIPAAGVGSLLVLLFALDGNIGRSDGMALLALFCAYMAYLTYQTKRHPVPSESSTDGSIGVSRAILLVVMGLIGLSAGGELCVDGATAIAQAMGVSDAIIGLTIVALGTSLPELATSVIAAMRHHSDLAMGNCIGSCTFNIFFVLAFSGIIHPLDGYPGLTLDAAMALLGPALVWGCVMLSPRRELSRPAGALLLLVYAAYLTYRLWAL